MQNKVIGKCPVCDNKLFVTELCCKSCDTKIQGEFELSSFDFLTRMQQEFLLVFIKNAGNIKMIEKDLGISYPTVKKYLGDIQQALGFKESVDIKEDELTKQDILNKLKNGEIDFEDADKMIKDLED